MPRRATSNAPRPTGLARAGVPSRLFDAVIFGGTEADRSRVEFCTIIARNYLAHARVLAASLTEHYPDRRLVVLVIDDDDTEVDPRVEPFDVLRPGDLDLDQREFRTWR